MKQLQNLEEEKPLDESWIDQMEQCSGQHAGSVAETIEACMRHLRKSAKKKAWTLTFRQASLPAMVWPFALAVRRTKRRRHRYAKNARRPRIDVC